ncbi:5617_t:CDS:1 [Paraglomus brasilianum]|uniref:5617_t:CDS:1 n=1 Tax=Paraglomus brasilianum TaxID=144538 RepID=A0A9N9BGS1_9GLOM|nr:5617_t:CDS:1 [Paraglomus brasilianum]
MSSELELLKQRVTKLEAENTKLKQIIEEIANLRIENTKLKQIIKQNRTINNVSQSSVSPVLSVTLQTPIPSSIIAHSNADNNIDSVNLEQIQSAIYPANNNLNHPSAAKNILDNTSNHSATASDNSDVYQESDIQYTEPLIRNHQKIRKLMIFRIGYIIIRTD